MVQRLNVSGEFYKNSFRYSLTPLNISKDRVHDHCRRSASCLWCLISWALTVRCNYVYIKLASEIY